MFVSKWLHLAVVWLGELCLRLQPYGFCANTARLASSKRDWRFAGRLLSPPPSTCTPTPCSPSSTHFSSWWWHHVPSHLAVNALADVGTLICVLRFRCDQGCLQWGKRWWRFKRFHPHLVTWFRPRGIKHSVITIIKIKFIRVIKILTDHFCFPNIPYHDWTVTHGLWVYILSKWILQKHVQVTFQNKNKPSFVTVKIFIIVTLFSWQLSTFSPKIFIIVMHTDVLHKYFIYIYIF